ncbi:MAG: hypothetical protein WC421_03635 [Elusimicrobiales bacterium]
MTIRYDVLSGRLLELMRSRNISAGTPREVGDRLADMVGREFREILDAAGSPAAEYHYPLSRKAMADFSFTDRDGFVYHVDVKTHLLEKGFHMPNLTSVKRLAEFYGQSDKNYFLILNIDYENAGPRQIVVRSVALAPIEFFCWDCLRIGALGWGQIQIANACCVNINPGNRRKAWMLELCNKLFTFYPKEVEKIRHRKRHFDKVKRLWEAKQEVA